MLLIAGVSLVILVVAYAWLIRRFKIERPADPFRYPTKLWWIGWVAAALIPAALVGVLYWSRFDEAFGLIADPTAGAISAGFVTWLALVLLFQVIVCIPGVTPRKFANHPLLLQFALRTVLTPKGKR
jgi:hypothetical protein